MAKTRLTAKEKEIYLAAMGRKDRNGAFIEGSIGSGKGLSTHREENVTKHLVDPDMGARHISLRDCAMLITTEAPDGTRDYQPFDLDTFYRLIREAQGKGKAGDGTVQVVWSPHRLATLLGGSPTNWVAWTRVAVGQSGQRFLLPITLTDLGPYDFLANQGFITRERRSPVLTGLTTTAMVCYLMAQTRWEDVLLVRRLQKCVNKQAGHLEPLLPLLSDEPKIPVADPNCMEAVLALLPEPLPLPAPPPSLDLPEPPPLPAPPPPLSQMVLAEKSSDELREMIARAEAQIAQAQAELAVVEQREKQRGFQRTVTGEYRILSGTPNQDYSLADTLTVEVDETRTAVYAFVRVVETTILET